MIEIETSTIDPFILSIRLVFNIVGVLITTGTFITLMLSWRQNELFGRLITIFAGATSVGSLSATYIRIMTLNPEVLNYPNHWQLQIIPSIAVNIALAIFVPVAITLHLAFLDAKIQDKRWVKVILFINYGILIGRTLMAIVIPSSVAQSITISASRDLSFVRQPIAVVYTANALLNIALTVFVIIRWRATRIWQFALNNFAVITSWIWLQTPFGQYFSGLHTTAVLVLAAIHIAVFSFRNPETNVALRLSRQRQQTLKRTDTLYRIGRLLNEKLDSKQILHALVNETQQVFNAENVSLLLLNEDASPISYQQAGIEQPDIIAEMEKAVKQPDPAMLKDSNAMQTLVNHQGKLLGVLRVQSMVEDEFDTYEHDLLDAIGEQAATALNNAQLLNAEQHSRQQAEVMFEVAQNATEELRLETEARKALEISAAIQAERDRIGRETHDGLLQRLSGARLRIERWPELLETDHNQTLQQEFNLLKTELLRGTTDLRQLIHGLHEGKATVTFSRQIADTIALVEATYEVNVNNLLSFDITSFTQEAEHELTRIVQEAINNAGKHAQATEIWLSDTLLPDQSGIQIEIRDNGVGFDTRAARDESSFGLNNMQVRTALLGGRFSIHSEPNNGTTIQLTVPFIET